MVLDHSGTPEARFVAQIYLDLLDRPVDPGGLAAWTAALNQGASRMEVVQAIEGSPEYRSMAVQELYARFLHRPADPSGLSTFTTLLANGGTMEQVAAALLGSAEYFQHQGGSVNDGFLDALYRDALHRTADAPGRTAFDQVLSHGISRGQVAAAVLGSEEFGQDLVQDFYQRFLHRSADPAGLQAWTGVLQAGVRDDEVSASIIGSAEYFAQV